MDRILWTALVLATCGAGWALMAKGWRSRLARQSAVEAPPVSDGTAELVLDPVPGLYVGTTSAADWLDRITVHRLSDRATGELCLATDGVHLLRDGLPEVFVPTPALRSVSVEQSLAGKVVSTGMLVLTWQLGDREVATAFRADDPSDHSLIRNRLMEAA